MAEAADRDVNRALRARFDEVYGDYQRLRSGMDDLQQRLAGLRATARSEDGLVTATVGPRGQLVHLELDRAVHRDLRPDELADLIVAVTAAAATKVAGEVQRLLAGHFPASSGTMRFLRSNDLGSLLDRQDEAS
ncbi:YbaB/EbfC family nucleoid-associated protein [Actinoplanes sp. RD1]|uniref:YbaB/EbfC family nucleoid-associated protein n=1 Tax=Actinoplanes sp. RD1 TaxID=3064538 RepID=UPI002742828C|nr:YbaB/EbfC family nucleoid-associated protein [Actinoplanes sp. RD1]